jgi:p-cumate 2,3-dioxygenase subunit beta
MQSQFERREAEDFLFHEAELLDSWRLVEWDALFADDGRYMVHTANISEDASPDRTLFYVADDRLHIRERVTRLGKNTAFAERPRSHVRHFVTNILVDQEPDGAVAVRCNLLVHRWRDRVDTFAGRAKYKISLTGSGPKIIEKRCILDYGDLRLQERISIIL